MEDPNIRRRGNLADQMREPSRDSSDFHLHLVAEVAQLVAAGRREIVLTGIHLGHYGIDFSRGRPKSEWCRLWHLLRRLDRLPGDFRIRLSSLEAAEARDELVGAMAKLPRVVPHLHLCLQSGSDRVLARMRRRYRVAGSPAIHRTDQNLLTTASSASSAPGSATAAD